MGQPHRAAPTSRHSRETSGLFILLSRQSFGLGGHPLQWRVWSKMVLETVCKFHSGRRPAASALPGVALHRRITVDTAASGALIMALSLGLWPQSEFPNNLLELDTESFSCVALLFDEKTPGANVGTGWVVEISFDLSPWGERLACQGRGGNWFVIYVYRFHQFFLRSAECDPVDFQDIDTFCSIGYLNFYDKDLWIWSAKLPPVVRQPAKGQASVKRSWRDWRQQRRDYDLQPTLLGLLGLRERPL